MCFYHCMAESKSPPYMIATNVASSSLASNPARAKKLRKLFSTKVAREIMQYRLLDTIRLENEDGEHIVFFEHPFILDYLLKSFEQLVLFPRTEQSRYFEQIKLKFQIEQSLHSIDNVEKSYQFEEGREHNYYVVITTNLGTTIIVHMLSSSAAAAAADDEEAKAVAVKEAEAAVAAFKSFKAPRWRRAQMNKEQRDAKRYKSSRHVPVASPDSLRVSHLPISNNFRISLPTLYFDKLYQVASHWEDHDVTEQVERDRISAKQLLREKLPVVGSQRLAMRDVIDFLLTPRQFTFLLLIEEQDDPDKPSIYSITVVEQMLEYHAGGASSSSSSLLSHRIQTLKL